MAKKIRKKVKRKVKKVKRKTTKKAKRKKTAKREVVEPVLNLHERKLEIMKAVPIMPCSAINKDRQGLMYAHTQAEKVFAIYYQKCVKQRLVINMVDLLMLSHEYQNHEGDPVPCSRAVCKFQIRCVDTGELEVFWGSALGDNDVWSDQSAQTVAMKQGLLLYFQTAWPQPDNFIEVVRKELASLEKKEMYQAIKNIIPKALTTKEAMSELWEYFGTP